MKLKISIKFRDGFSQLKHSLLCYITWVDIEILHSAHAVCLFVSLESDNQSGDSASSINGLVFVMGIANVGHDFMKFIHTNVSFFHCLRPLQAVNFSKGITVINVMHPPSLPTFLPILLHSLYPSFPSATFSSFLIRSKYKSWYCMISTYSLVTFHI